MISVIKDQIPTAPRGADFEQGMREAALVASSIIGQTGFLVKEGVKLNDLDLFAAKLCDTLKAKPYNLNYKPDWASSPFPAVLSTSVNNEIAHGIPDEYALKPGDIVTLDIGITFNGYCGDCAITLPVGDIENKHERLLRFANRACYMGIQAVKDGALVTDISRAIETYALQNGYVTCQTLSGHGIGKEMHEEPTIPFFYSHDSRYIQRFGMRRLKAGEVICIEPMLTFKDKGSQTASDGWTVLTRDAKFSAMFEHMVLVTKDGYEILTDHFVKA